MKHLHRLSGCALLSLVGLLVASWSMVRAAEPTSKLVDAAERQDWAQVRSLLSNRAEITAAQPDGMTALHWAAWHDQRDLVRELITAGADVSASNRYGVTPLSIACTNGSAEVIEKLLDGGADPNSTLRGGEAALMTASRTGNAKAVGALLARGARVDAKERKGQTALMWAAAEGNAEVVDLLLKAGADLHAELASGFTPLLFAIREGRGEVVKLLLSAGADPKAAMSPKKSGGKSPRGGTSPLVMAVENGHFEVAVQLLDAGSDPNDQRTGYTPLHILTWVRKPNRGDGDDGDPSPIGSGTMDSLAFARILVQRGADVNARLDKGSSGKGVLSRKGATPFLMAAMTADVPYMRLLLELGADSKLPNAEESTALMAASGLGALAPEEQAGTEEEVLEAVNLLLDLGSDINAVDANGETAMHGAAYKNFPRVIELLAERGASIEVWNRPNKHGWTPQQIADGYRPGNFKPSVETAAALRHVLQK